MWWMPYNFFHDIENYDSQRGKMITPDVIFREKLENTPTKHMSYLTLQTLTNEYDRRER
jgi:hypothetical protein